MKKLGIIGGMGPAATARLFAQIVAMTDVDADQEHLDITILNRPTIPDRTAYLLGKRDAKPFLPVLLDMVQELEDAGCEVLAMPCNTAHAAAPDIQAACTKATLVNMLERTASFAAELGVRRVGVLATDGTVETGVYQRALAKSGLDTVVPEEPEQRQVMSLIYEYVKAGRVAPPELFVEVCESLQGRGCEAIILGCTELSLIGAPRMREGMYIIDALDVLAWSCVNECGAPARNLKQEFLKESSPLARRAWK